MDNITLIGAISIITAGLTTCLGCVAPALAEGRSVASALGSLAQQPDAGPTITRTLF
ncbi:MAG: F0F1 ATP synthase subunit C, partial [Flavobacteriales bacterium]|nr:F0F1 ATP synthase subunit C [Flavobacteriales bacterium]